MIKHLLGATLALATCLPTPALAASEPAAPDPEFQRAQSACKAMATPVSVAPYSVLGAWMVNPVDTAPTKPARLFLFLVNRITSLHRFYVNAIVSTQGNVGYLPDLLIGCNPDTHDACANAKFLAEPAVVRVWSARFSGGTWPCAGMPADARWPVRCAPPAALNTATQTSGDFINIQLNAVKTSGVGNPVWIRVPLRQLP